MIHQTIIWAPSSEFVSSGIPSWQILTAHAQPFRGTRDLAFCLKVPHDSLLVWASSGGSGEPARMRRLAWTFAARIGDKYQIRLTGPICNLKSSEKDFSRQFYSQNCDFAIFVPKCTHDWQVNSICSKSTPYDQAKNLMIFNFTIFPSNLTKNTNTNLCVFKSFQYTWDNGSVWDKDWPHQIYVGHWPIFCGPVILLDILMTIWWSNVIVDLSSYRTWTKSIKGFEN